MRTQPRGRAALQSLLASILVAVVWWLITPAGLVGSIAGTWILTGVILLLVGLFVAAGGDRVLDNMLPGANVGRMTEQGLQGDRRFLPPRTRWGGALMMIGGVAYVGAGWALWLLR